MKNIVRVLAIIMCLALMVSFAACGSKTEEPASEASSAAPASSAAEETSSEEETPAIGASGKFTSIEAFINSDEMKSQLDNMKESLGNDNMKIDITANGDQLVYTFTYSAAALEGADLEVMSSALEDALDSMSETFEKVASSLTEAVEVEDPVVLVVYETEDGTELCARAYTATPGEIQPR